MKNSALSTKKDNVLFFVCNKFCSDVTDSENAQK